jgi:hypothetical protein
MVVELSASATMSTNIVFSSEARVFRRLIVNYIAKRLRQNNLYFPEKLLVHDDDDFEPLSKAYDASDLQAAFGRGR